MQTRSLSYALAGAVLLTCAASADDFGGGHHGQGSSVQLGPRPFYLVGGMDEGLLKHRLEQCAHGPFRRTDFSIGHRGRCATACARTSATT
jgi:glycerophosphoryl diester phosphodiesterase